MKKLYSKRKYNRKSNNKKDCFCFLYIVLFFHKSTLRVKIWHKVRIYFRERKIIQI